MGEFGAVSVVSGHIRGQTNTMPLHVEILYNEYQFAARIRGSLALLARCAGDAGWRSSSRPLRKRKKHDMRDACIEGRAGPLRRPTPSGIGR